MIPAFEKASRGRSVGGDGRERLIQFVGDRSGHFTHQGDAVEMGQLLALVLQFQIGLLLRTDVDANADYFGKLSLFVLQTSSAHDHPARFPKGKHQPMLALEGLSTRRRRDRTRSGRPRDRRGGLA